ncbi:MAG: hypothetical protein O3C57_07900 [Verrucomicrobia bacterium]|nr:hypothetical protein [Verrucomicrobiota bacterium]
MQNLERNLGVQPLDNVMRQHNLKPHDLVAASKVPMTHKMAARAMRGRRLTANTKHIVVNALNAATGRDYTFKQLFTY